MAPFSGGMIFCVNRGSPTLLTMKISRQLLGGTAVVALLCFGAANGRAQGHTYNLTAITCGNWNSAGIHDPTTLYEIGYSFTRLQNQISYFEFNLTPLMGKTVTNAYTLIPGSTDYSISDYWSVPTENNLNDHDQFKVGMRPMCSTGDPETLNEILTGNNNSSLYVNINDSNRNPDLGYGWVMDGFHFGKQFDTYHYESTGQVGPYIQNAVNAGGDYIIWANDDFDSGNTTGENYIWGSTSYNTDIVLTIVTTN
jgi:hypothetical protein